MQDKIRRIIKGLSNTSGEEAFQRFVQNLAQAVDADRVFIGRVNPDHNTITTLAYFGNSRLQANITVSLRNTPCERVLSGEACLFERNVSNLFPDFPGLKEFNIEGYAGIAIRDSNKQAIGVLSCLFSQPMPHPRETLELMDLFANRIGGEIERIESVRALARLNQQLEQKVEERTAQLTQINTELEAFCYSISHDLRAPLRAIRGFTEALAEDYGAQLDEAALRYLGRIRTNAQTMGQLLTDLLSLSQLTSQPLQPVRFNLADLLPPLIDEQRVRYPQLVVNTHVARQLMVEADRGMMRVLLGNLVSNAFKYARHDVGLELELGQIEQRGEPTIFLRDNGTGIPAAKIPTAFNPFARFHNNPEIEGNGIGLATCKRIVVKHQGQIHIVPNHNHGITVEFTLEGLRHFCPMPGPCPCPDGTSPGEPCPERPATNPDTCN